MKPTKTKLAIFEGKKIRRQWNGKKENLRIIQSIPSPNAEPFKLWLARVGYEREINSLSFPRKWESSVLYA